MLRVLLRAWLLGLFIRSKINLFIPSRPIAPDPTNHLRRTLRHFRLPRLVLPRFAVSMSVLNLLDGWGLRSESCAVCPGKGCLGVRWSNPPIAALLPAWLGFFTPIHRGAP